MESPRIAKTMTRIITICVLALALATAVGAQQSEHVCEHQGRTMTGFACLDLASTPPVEPATTAGEQVFKDKDGYSYYIDNDRNMIYCGSYAPDGKYVPCPGKSEGIIKQVKEKLNKAKEKVEKIKKALDPKELFKDLSLTSSDSPWCHETRNPRPRVNCIEYIPPAANATGAGGTDTINVHPPAVATADPFDSAYESYQTPAASRYGRDVGRALARKAEREQREAEHRRFLSTLDQREGRTGELKVKSGYQAAIGATAVPRKPLAPSRTVQRPNYGATVAPSRTTQRSNYSKKKSLSTSRCRSRPGQGQCTIPQ